MEVQKVEFLGSNVIIGGDLSGEILGGEDCGKVLGWSWEVIGMSRLVRDEPWMGEACCLGESSGLVIGESWSENFEGFGFGLVLWTLMFALHCFKMRGHGSL